MPQALVCSKCKEPFVFTGASIELVGESRIGCRHRCGAMNELQYLRTDESGTAVYRVAGVVPGVHVNHAAHVDDEEGPLHGCSGPCEDNRH